MPGQLAACSFKLCSFELCLGPWACASWLQRCDPRERHGLRALEELLAEPRPLYLGRFREETRGGWTEPSLVWGPVGGRSIYGSLLADAPSLPTCAASGVPLTTAKQLPQLLFWLAPLPLAPRVSSSSSPTRSRLPSFCFCVDAAAK